LINLDRNIIVKAKCLGKAQYYIKGVEQLNEPGLTYAMLKEYLTQYYSGDQIENEVGGTHSTCGGG